jgi:exopolyphosphatase/guanosine-5'-triphosphate,3'-diphosphate pyrophosphatase
MGFGEQTGIFAALDLGTTNCRLLIARPSGRDSLRIVDSFSRIVRLGEGLDAAGSLSETAMERAIDALSVCAAKLRNRRVTRGRFVATEACRRAANCGNFLERVRDHTGLTLEIIQTAEEARLALAGCAPLLDPHCRSAIVFDIGGGSTEVIWVMVRPASGGGRPLTTIRGVISVPYGVVSLTERFRDQPDQAAAFEEMAALVQSYLTAFDEDWEIARQVRRGEVQMLGSSGTVTTLAAVHMGLSRYDRAMVDGALLDQAAVHSATELLIGAGTGGRALQPCIGLGRADLMVAGCAILAAICRTWPVPSLRVADRGVREGILAGLMAESRRYPYQPVSEPWPIAVQPSEAR